MKWKFKILSFFLSVVYVIVFIKVPAIFSRHTVGYINTHGILNGCLRLLYDHNLLSPIMSVISDMIGLSCIAVFLILVKNKWNGQRKYFRTFSEFSFLSLRLKPAMLSVLLGIGATQIVVFLFQILPENMQNEYNTVLELPTGYHAEVSFYVLFVFTYILLGPVTEEAVFRGLVYGTMRKSWGVLMSVSFTSILFAGIHGNIFQTFYAFLMGIVLCMVQEKYSSIIYSVICHIAFNLFGSGLFFSETSKTGMELGCVLFIVSGTLIITDKSEQIKRRGHISNVFPKGENR